MHRLWYLVAASVFAGAAHAATLSGRVIDPAGQGIPRVSLVTDQRGIGVQADDSGYFRFTIVESVTRVTFTAVGYQPRQFPATQIPSVVQLETAIIRGQDILVAANRAELGITPIAFDNLSQAEIARDYTVSELPLLLQSTPNLYAFSDGGGKLGYSYLSIRGFDDKRVAVYINGVPLNDPEDQATYFVDLPDFAASVSDIQVQRGIGNSLYGDASFGGSVNIVTNAIARDRTVKLATGFGQYQADGRNIGQLSKQSVEYASGLIEGRWLMAGRFSRQSSSGYRIGSWYNGWSYYFALARLDPRMTTELHLYGGPMTMHLSYLGAPRNVIDTLRRYNPQTYGNETDNFNQPHYQLHTVYRLTDRSTLSNTLYYIRGKGYYEQYVAGARYADYGLDGALAADSIGDLVRQQRVQKNQVGWNPRLEITHARGKHVVGASGYWFESEHWGQLVWAQFLTGALDPTYRYYRYTGRKWLGSLYAQEEYQLSEKIRMHAGVSLRYLDYRFRQDRMGAFAGYRYDIDWLFLSPRFGLTHTIRPDLSVYVNGGIASRTPNDAAIYDAGDPNKFPSLEIRETSIAGSDTTYVFGDPTAKNEQVANLELGTTLRRDQLVLSGNLFWMQFQDEILPYGGVNPSNGVAYTINVPRSLHAGIELNADMRPTPELTINANAAVNYNRIQEYAATFGWALDSAGTLLAGDTIVDFADQVIPLFPEYLGNLTLDYHKSPVRLTTQVRLVGKQYLELTNDTSLATDPYATVALSAAWTFPNIFGIGTLILSGRVDNLFNEKYLASGYGYNWAERSLNSGPALYNGAEYYVGGERTWYVQAQLEMF